jgi:FlaA1/EpsC-like NDP-sugar epimerase
MGATKRAAETAISALATEHPGTRFMAVRFGNVLGSSGSVIPKFKEQIAWGGPVTVTHADITRYFMTIPEAARLVLQAAAVGENGQMLVLDMGEPVLIVNLARDLIRLAGHTAVDIPIEFTGLRPGEKELLSNTEQTLKAPIRQLRVAVLAAMGPDSSDLDAPFPTSAVDRRDKRRSGAYCPEAGRAGVRSGLSASILQAMSKYLCVSSVWSLVPA